MEIKTYLLEKGIPPQMKGFYYLEYAIGVCLKDKEKVFSMMEIYGRVAKNYGINVNQVVRNIRTALYKCDRYIIPSQFIAQATLEIDMLNTKQQK